MIKKLSALERSLERIQMILGKNKTSSDLTTRQVRAFLMIAKASVENDPLTCEDVRRLLNLSSQGAHKIVKYFVERGLVERQVATFDGRARNLVLTEEGLRTMDALKESVETGMREVGIREVA